jgi:hypothetical protein
VLSAVRGPRDFTTARNAALMHGETAAGSRVKRSASSAGTFIACCVPIHPVIDGCDSHERRRGESVKRSLENARRETQSANACVSSADGFEADD